MKHALSTSSTSTGYNAFCWVDVKMKSCWCRQLSLGGDDWADAGYLETSGPWRVWNVSSGQMSGLRTHSALWEYHGTHCTLVILTVGFLVPFCLWDFQIFADFAHILNYNASKIISQKWSPLAGCASNKTRPWIFTRATFPRVFAARDPIVHWSQLVTSHSVHWVTQFRILCLELLLLSPAGTYNSQPHKPLWVNINDFMLVKWACKCSMFIKDSPNSIKLWCSWMYQTDHHRL